MRFKTILITHAKRKIVFIIVLLLIIIITFVVLNANSSTAVFGLIDDVDYVEILDKTLPNEKEDINIIDKIKLILGFDLDKPQTIIADYEPALGMDDATNEKEAVDEKENADIAKNDSDEELLPQNDTITYPTKADILSGVGLQMNNATSYNVDLKSLCAKDNLLNVELNAEPQVLIVHTHSTECYDGDEMNGETERTTDETKNIIAVGDVIANVLESNGIHCVHDKTVHDYPSYQGAYTRTLSTIEYNLEKYSDIKIVLDIHRDAYIYPDGSKLTVKCEENGVQTAKVMLVVGTDSLGLYNPNWQDNLSFATHIQSAANIMYPNMMRPIDLRRERFNMHVTKGSILMEIGSNGNTLDEAKEGGKNIANALSAVLLMN